MLLSAHANVNLQDDKGLTPLMVVCHSHTPNIDLVKLLVQSGADINVEEGKTKVTALLQAIMSGHTQIVQYLLDKGADINALSKDGNSSLMTACYYQHEDIIHLLLNYKADANIQNTKTTSTALHLACSKQLATAVELLLAHGADPNVLNNLECTPLIYACSNYDQPMEPTIPVMLLSAGANPDIQSRDGATALMRAAHFDYQEGVKILLNAGVDVNTQSSSGMTALHYAACKGHSAVTQLLLTSNASTSITESTGSTPLDLALDGDHQDVCQLLLLSSYLSDPSEIPQTLVQQPHLQQPVLRHSHIQPDTFPTIHQLRYALEHPLTPAETVKRYQADDDDDEKEHVDNQS